MASTQETSSGSGEAKAPISAASLFAELGLAPEDVDALAQMPESEISIETLPFLIMQLKSKKTETGKASTTKSDEDAPAESRDNSKKPTTSSRHDNSASSAPTTPSSSSQTRTERSSSGATRGHGDGEGGHRSRRDSKNRNSHERWHSDNLHKAPHSHQLSDFHGDVPHSFPHTCSLCLCMVNSRTTWKEHLHGVRHEASKKKFVKQYPKWESHQHESSSPYSNYADSRSRRPMKRPIRSPGEPFQNQDMPTPKRMATSTPFKPPKRYLNRTRVVVAKFPLGSVSVQDLLDLAEPFGTVVKHLVFPAKGFLEFKDPKEAYAMVAHFYDKLDFVKQHKLHVYLSPTVLGIQMPGDIEEENTSRPSKFEAVLFSRLPEKKETQEKVLEVVKMFGEVRRSKFSGSEAQIEMVDREDARLMVKYYYECPLKILGVKVRVTLLTDPKLALRDSPERSHGGSRSKGDDSKQSSSSSSKEKKDGEKEGETVEETAEEPPAEEQQVRSGPCGVASQPDAEWANLREEDLDPFDMAVEDMELGHEDDEDDEGGEHDMEEQGIPAEDEEGLMIEDEEAKEEEANEASKVKEPSENTALDSSEAPNRSAASGEEDNQDDDKPFDFPDNLEDFVTLDELDSGADNPEHNDFQGGKVVLIRPLIGYPSQMELRRLTAPFGNLVHHTVSRFRQEALLQLENEKQVQEMVAFYKSSKENAILKGRAVTISVCRTLKELEGPSGRSIYIGNLPKEKFTDLSLLYIAEQFGSIKAYRINQRPRSCYIQFNTKDAAQAMLKKFGTRPPKFKGHFLTVCICRKPDSAISWITPPPNMGLSEERPEEQNGEDRRERSRRLSSKREDLEGSCGDQPSMELEEKDEKEKTSEEMEELQSGTPAGLHYIVPVSGFFCKLCNIFYSKESAAREEHCSSEEHHKNLKARGRKKRASSPGSQKASESSKTTNATAT